MDLDELRRLLMTDDPYPALSQLRSESNLHRIGERQWLVLSYNLARSVLSDTSRFISGPLGPALAGGLREGGAAHDYVTHRINFCDPPRHTDVRHAVDRWFSPRRVNELVPNVEAIATELAAELSGTCELVDAFAHPLPARVICTLLGANEPEELGTWGEDLAMLLSIGRTPEQIASGERAAEQMSEWVAGLDGPDIDLDTPTRTSLVMTLFAAGHHTTRDAFVNGMHALLRHSAQIDAARNDPAAAVAEFLRFDTPTQLVSRVTATSVELEGETIPPFSQVAVALGAANRDPERFDEPDTFDVARTRNVPISFAPGPHHCLGAPLALLELRVMLSTILGRWPRIRLIDPDAPVPHRPSAVFHGRTSLDVELVA
ncbi:MAG: cytochrome P450 [Acidimicrobiia bacterium]|nr:cytochrome P450 [Acidimicrobiia bacterium]